MEGPMQHAVRQAGIAMPHNERIWLWLKDKAPTPQPASAIASALKIKPNHVAAMCNDLEQRGMIVRSMERMRIVGKGGTRVDREVSFFTVSSRMGGVYELLPKPRKEKSTPETDTKIKQYSSPFVPAPTPAPAPEVKKDFSPESFVEKLSLKQSKELYMYLRGIFEGRE